MTLNNTWIKLYTFLASNLQTLSCICKQFTYLSKSSTESQVIQKYCHWHNSAVCYLKKKNHANNICHSMKIVSKSLLSRSSGYGILFYLLQIQKMKAKKKIKWNITKRTWNCFLFCININNDSNVFNTWLLKKFECSVLTRLKNHCCMHFHWFTLPWIPLLLYIF